MNAQRPSRLALAVFDLFIADNDPLRGDLVEEFEVRQSQWWLWRQVIGALVSRRPIVRWQQTPTMTVVGAALLLLVSFEAVLAVNVARRLIFGPPMPDITGYFYLWQQGAPGQAHERAVRLVVWIPALLSVFASMPVGWLIARLHQRHGRAAVGVVTLSVVTCAVSNLGSPFAYQFLTMLVFIVGLLVGGRLAPSSTDRPARASRFTPAP